MAARVPAPGALSRSSCAHNLSVSASVLADDHQHISCVCFALRRPVLAIALRCDDDTGDTDPPDHVLVLAHHDKYTQWRRVKRIQMPTKAHIIYMCYAFDDDELVIALDDGRVLIAGKLVSLGIGRRVVAMAANAKHIIALDDVGNAHEINSRSAIRRIRVRPHRHPDANAAVMIDTVHTSSIIVFGDGFSAIIEEHHDQAQMRRITDGDGHGTVIAAACLRRDRAAGAVLCTVRQCTCCAVSTNVYMSWIPSEPEPELGPDVRIPALSRHGGEPGHVSVYNVCSTEDMFVFGCQEGEVQLWSPLQPQRALVEFQLDAKGPVRVCSHPNAPFIAASTKSCVHIIAADAAQLRQDTSAAAQQSTHL